MILSRLSVGLVSMNKLIAISYDRVNNTVTYELLKMFFMQSLSLFFDCRDSTQRNLWTPLLNGETCLFKN